MSNNKELTATEFAASQKQVKTRRGTLLTGMLSFLHQAMDDAAVYRVGEKENHLPKKEWRRRKNRRKMRKQTLQNQRRKNCRIKKKGKPGRNIAAKRRHEIPTTKQFKYEKAETTARRMENLDRRRRRRSITREQFNKLRSKILSVIPKRAR